MNRTDSQTEAGRLFVRDLDRIREKSTVSLDGRRVLILSIAIFLLMSASFAAGILFVDKRPVTASHVSDKAIAGAVVEGALPRSSVEPSLSFGRDAGARKGSVLPAPSRPPAVARGGDFETAASAARRGLAPIPYLWLTWDEPWPAVAVTDPSMGMSCVFADRGGCVPPPPPAPPSPRPLVKTVANAKKVAAPTQIHEPTQSRSVTRKKTPHRKAAAPAPEPYCVQVRAYRDETKAREFAAELRAKGYHPSISRYSDPGGTLWFRVRLGRFAGPAKALEFARYFNRREKGEAAIPVSLKSKR